MHKECFLQELLQVIILVSSRQYCSKSLWLYTSV